MGCQKYYWLIAALVVSTSTFTSLFDFSLSPRSFEGLYITRPHYGLHSWSSAHAAWTARSHLNYGFAYTKGYLTPVVGDPPPEYPQHYVSHPPLESWIAAMGMMLLGSEDWSLRLFEIILDIPLLFVILFFLRSLYGDGLSLLAGLLLVLLPLSAYFGSEAKGVAASLWMLCRYLSLTGKLPIVPSRLRRYLIELSLALVLSIQLEWMGVFYAAMICLHYLLTCLVHRRLQLGLLLVLIGMPTLSAGFNVLRMARGYQLNAKATQAIAADLGETVDQKPETPWHLMKTLFVWRATSGERESFSWSTWLGRHGKFALTNFTTPVLSLLVLYLLYRLMAQSGVLLSRVRSWVSPANPRKLLKPPYMFDHMWFFFWPGVLFLLTFKGLIWSHQYWQSPLAPFVVLGCSQGIFLFKDVAACLWRWLGQSMLVGLLIVVIVSCNQGLVAYRDVRWQSPYTIDLFRRLNREIPRGKALLTFKDFMIQQNKPKAAFYRPEYAWYLDREMIVANAWPGDYYSALAARLVNVVSDTVREIQAQAASGRYPFYYIPASRKPGESLTNYSLYFKLPEQPDELASLTNLEVHRLLNDDDWSDDDKLYEEKAYRYHGLLIKKLKKLYAYEYVPNPAFANHRDYCHWGDTPGYLFDLTRPIP